MYRDEGYVHDLDDDHDGDDHHEHDHGRRAHLMSSVGPIIAEVVDITPEIAIEYLKHANPNNRTQSMISVRRFSSAMRSGLWRMNGEPIAFDSSGILQNGHHRLHAVIMYGKPVEFLVLRGVDGGLHDEGKPRDVRDALAMAKVFSRYERQQASVGLAMLGALRRSWTFGDLTASARADAIKKAADLQQLDASTAAVYGRKLSFVSKWNIPIALAHYHAATAGYGEQADAWLEQLRFEAPQCKSVWDTCKLIANWGRQFTREATYGPPASTQLDRQRKYRLASLSLLQFVNAKAGAMPRGWRRIGFTPLGGPMIAEWEYSRTPSMSKTRSTNEDDA